MIFNYDQPDIVLPINDTIPWIEKYRPSSLDDIVHQNEIILTLKKFIKDDCLPHLLFYGIPGTGKTSTIIACAKQIFKNNYPFMVMELNASDDRGIETVRSKIKQFVSTNGNFASSNSFKLVILDETDAMTNDAQAILRKVVEEFTKVARFCLICNYIKKIIPALQSRCTKFRFYPISTIKMKDRLSFIAKKENIPIKKSGISEIIKIADGDMRKAINSLQSCFMTCSIVDRHSVDKCIGYPDIETITHILNILFTQNFLSAFDNIKHIMEIHELSLSDVMFEICFVIISHIILDDNSIILQSDFNKLSKILADLQDIEANKSSIIFDDIQLSAIISSFILNK
jgi:replication factor C subunit 3/5